MDVGRVGGGFFNHTQDFAGLSDETLQQAVQHTDRRIRSGD